VREGEAPVAGARGTQLVSKWLVLIYIFL
jgi:hypothetical protein